MNMIDAGKIPRHFLAQAIVDKTIGLESWQELAKVVAAFLIESHRENELPMIMRDVMQIRLQAGIVEAVVETAHEPSPQTLDLVKKQLRAAYPDAKQLIIHSKLDSAMIGGLRIILPQTELDASLLKKLVDFKRVTMEAR